MGRYQDIRCTEPPTYRGYTVSDTLIVYYWPIFMDFCPISILSFVDVEIDP